MIACVSESWLSLQARDDATRCRRSERAHRKIKTCRERDASLQAAVTFAATGTRMPCARSRRSAEDAHEAPAHLGLRLHDECIERGEVGHVRRARQQSDQAGS